MTEKQDDFLYDRLGPWPQPNPILPNQTFPTVVHVPKQESWQYEWYIGLRYYTQIIYLNPWALWYAFKNPGLAPLPDADFCDFLCIRSFSKFLNAVTHEQIVALMPGIDASKLKSDRLYYISDQYLMARVPSQEGLFTAPTVSLFSRASLDSYEYTAEAIWVQADAGTSTVLYPADGQAWELAKYYAVEGCAYRLVLSIHSIMHFPMDIVNSITKTALPTKHLLFKLLYAHFDFSLELNLGVQTSYSSPIKNHWEFPYTGMTGTAAQIAELFAASYEGIEGHYVTYPPFHFNVTPMIGIDTMYADFQREYYACCLKFVKKVLAKLSDDEKAVIPQWADYISGWINRHVKHDDAYMDHTLRHFPDGSEIFKVLPDGDNLLDKVVAKIIWDLTVGHAGDHYDFAMMDMTQVAMRLRVPAPDSNKIPYYDPKKLRTFIDTYKHRMLWRIFFLPTNVTFFYDVDYKFEDPILQQYNREFLVDLQKTEDELATKGIRNFLPLKKISRSIQY